VSSALTETSVIVNSFTATAPVKSQHVDVEFTLALVMQEPPASGDIFGSAKLSLNFGMQGAGAARHTR